MRLATVIYNGKPRVVAAMTRGTLLDLHLTASLLGQDGAAFVDMVALAQAGVDGLDQAAALLQLAPGAACLHHAEISFLPPIQPVQFRNCRPLRGHQPQICTIGNRMSFIGHGADVIWPGFSNDLATEPKLAIVIGKQGRDIAAEQAPDHIFGYTILNDITACDAPPEKSKGFDTGNILGPYILTADEVPHPAVFDLQTRINGVDHGYINSHDMRSDFATILSRISASETIYPGEVIGSGTIIRSHQLAPDDQFELEIEGIGVLANRVVRGGSV